jgi:hypothetical protein
MSRFNLDLEIGCLKRAFDEAELKLRRRLDADISTMHEFLEASISRLYEQAEKQDQLTTLTEGKDKSNGRADH